MIARLTILLPFTLSVRQVDRFGEYEFDLGEHRVKIYPPCQAAVNPRDTEAVSPVPMNDVLELLKPADVQEVTDSILMDGAPTIQANLLQIDFAKAAFDRRRPPATASPEDLETHGDPSARLAFAVANSFLARIRSITRGSQVKSVSPKSTFWQLEYLTDNEEELPPGPHLVRRKRQAPYSFRVTGLNAEVWNKAQTLPVDFKLPTWEILLLDAEAALPEVGLCVVLGYTALETFVEWILNQLVPRGGVPETLWKWINERLDWQAPSVPEQFGQLLKTFSGKSLKDDNNLWEAFQNLRKARNSFVHEGKAFIGKDEVTVERATTLIVQAKAIVDWVEPVLPEALRRLKLERGVEFTFQKLVGTLHP